MLSAKTMKNQGVQTGKEAQLCLFARGLTVEKMPETHATNPTTGEFSEAPRNKVNIQK